jgi:hypothetical protein
MGAFDWHAAPVAGGNLPWFEVFGQSRGAGEVWRNNMELAAIWRPNQNDGMTPNRRGDKQRHDCIQE